METYKYDHIKWFPNRKPKLQIEENAICILATVGNGSAIGVNFEIINLLSATGMPKYEILEYIDLLLERRDIKIIFQPPSPEDWRYIATKKGELKLIEFKNNFDKKVTAKSKPIKGRRKKDNKDKLILIEHCFLHYFNQDPITNENKIIKSEKYDCSPQALYNNFCKLVKWISDMGSSGSKMGDEKRIKMYEDLIPLIESTRQQKKAKRDLKKFKKIYQEQIDSDGYSD